MGLTLNTDESVRHAIRTISRSKKSVLSVVSLKGISVDIQSYLMIMQYAQAAIKVILCKAVLYAEGIGSLSILSKVRYVRSAMSSVRYLATVAISLCLLVWVSGAMTAIGHKDLNMRQR